MHRKEASKEVFARIEQCCISACLGLGQSPYNRFLQSITPCKKDLEIIKQDLERLEQLEIANKNNEGLVRENTDLINRNLKLQDENKELRKAIKSWNENGGKLIRENTKLEKALEKSCERLDYTCPVEEELIADLDCEDCESNCKECWKKFFLKEVLDDDK